MEIRIQKNQYSQNIYWSIAQPSLGNSKKLNFTLTYGQPLICSISSDQILQVKFLSYFQRKTCSEIQSDVNKKHIEEQITVRYEKFEENDSKWEKHLENCKMILYMILSSQDYENPTLEINSYYNDLGVLFEAEKDFTIKLYRDADEKSIKSSPTSLFSKIEKIRNLLEKHQENVVATRVPSPLGNIRSFITTEFTNFLNINKFACIKIIIDTLLGPLEVKKTNSDQIISTDSKPLTYTKSVSLTSGNFKLTMDIWLTGEVEDTQVQVCSLIFDGSLEYQAGRSRKIDMRLISEMFSYIKTRYKACSISKNFQLIKFKSKSFRLSSDSADIFIETEQTLDRNVLESQVAMHVTTRFGNYYDYSKEIMLARALRECSEEVKEVFDGIDDKNFLINDGKKYAFKPLNSLQQAVLICELIELAKCLLKHDLVLILNEDLLKFFRLYKHRKFRKKSIQSLKSDKKIPLRINLRHNKSIPLHKALEKTKLNDPSTYLYALQTKFTQHSKPIPIAILSETAKKRFSSNKFNMIELPKHIAISRLSLYQDNPYDSCVIYHFIHKKSGRFFLVTEILECSLQKWIKELNDQQIFQIFSEVLKILIILATKQAAIMCFDLESILVTPELEVKFLIKSEEEINQEFLAPELKLGRGTSKSLSYSYGKFLKCFYVNRFESVSSQKIFLDAKHIIPKEIQLIIDKSTELSLLRRLDLRAIAGVLQVPISSL